MAEYRACTHIHIFNTHILSIGCWVDNIFPSHFLTIDFMRTEKIDIKDLKEETGDILLKKEALPGEMGRPLPK
jgi:hypothetical protein